MPEMIRVITADDSAVVRRIVAEVLNGDPSIEVMGTARNGEEAVRLVRANTPDVVLMDLEMPVMDGVQALREIRKSHPKLPVLVFSSLTVKGGEATLDALSAGASDYVPKPTGAGHVNEAVKYMQRELLPRIRQWGNPRPAVRRAAAAPPPPAPQRAAAPAAPTAARPPFPSPPRNIPAAPIQPRRGLQSPSGIDAILIASSTGGPNALSDVIAQLPGNLGIPILCVQHMPAVFTQLLAERLDKKTPLTVREGVDGAAVRPNEVWIAPGDYHMEVAGRPEDARLRIHQGPRENSCRPAADNLFRSAASVYGGNVLAVVLTGMGRDAADGCQPLVAQGARVIVQDEATSVVWGMPRAVAEAGLAHEVLPIGKIAAAVVKDVRAANKPVFS